MHIFAPDLIFIMQGRIGDRDASDKHRFQAGDRGQGTGASHLDFDVFDHRHFFLCREFIGNRPAWRAGDKAKSFLKPGAVNFKHDAVNIVRQTVSALAQPVDVVLAFGQTCEGSELR